MTWHKYNIIFSRICTLIQYTSGRENHFFPSNFFHRLDFNSYSRKIFFAINQIKIIEIQNYQEDFSRDILVQISDLFKILLCRELMKWTYYESPLKSLKENSRIFF